MESYKIENLTFSYPAATDKAIENISLSVEQGEFVTLCGKSGCGKTTLLRLLKSTLAPHGILSGNIYFNGTALHEIDSKEQAAKIGFVMQNPDNQIVTDKVWHELAFGLESLGFSSGEIRTRVSETASFFGIQTWFHKKVTELSGGQKQILNLASVMLMQPDVLILDEPTAQLDPIAAQEFLKTLEKINRELGTTVILSEHRLEDAFPISDRIVVMDCGKIIADAEPTKVGTVLKALHHDMISALPTAMRIYNSFENDVECPLTVRDGRIWLERYSENHPLDSTLIPTVQNNPVSSEPIIEINDVYFRYEKNSPDVIKNLNIQINKGEFFAVVGGNGTGKTTALSLICGLNTPYRGSICINGENISNIHNLYKDIMGVLPQNPQTLFVKNTVYQDLAEILSEKKLSKKEQENRIKTIAQLCRIDNLLQNHPYDLSGGEQQRAALAKVLLMSPKILLLDEPTKGLDAHFKQIFADIIKDLKACGVTIVMVSHDIEFCAEFADRCAMFFDGSITSCGEPRKFFSGNNFYTTYANRIARTRLPDAVLAEDIILACGGTPQKKNPHIRMTDIFPQDNNKSIGKTTEKKLSPRRIVFGCIFALLLFITITVTITANPSANNEFGLIHAAAVIQLAGALICFIPQKELGVTSVQQPVYKRKLTKRTLCAAFLILFAVPLTIYIGTYYFGDRKYYFISLLIIFETMIPFCMVFESRKPQARELVLISVLCAVAVAGRTAFFMIPQFKPVIALIIISGVCFGGETGFLVGAITGFVSNFFFGQGPWTPWQMFAFGIIGFISGILFRKGLLRKTKFSLCTFGFIATIILYGGIMNPASVIMYQSVPTKEMIISSYVMGLPYDIIHALSTVFFLWFVSEPMIEKSERIKVKYGLIEK